MTQSLRIGYIVPQFPGQTHIFFWREIQALEEMGHKVFVFSTRKPPGSLISHDWSDEAMARTTYLGSINPIRAGKVAAQLLSQGLARWVLKDGTDLLRDSLMSCSAAGLLLQKARELQLNHIHAHSCARASLIACFANKLGGPSYSHTLHGPLSDYGSGQRLKWENAGFATVITHKLLDEISVALAGHLPDRVTVRPMGVDTDVLKRKADYSAPRSGRPVRVFSCARLNIVKGHQDLMTATRQLIDQGVDIRVEIAGEDDDGGFGYRTELEAHLKKLRLQDHVKLLGAIDSDLVRQKLEQAHLFVLASWHEPLGVAYMEAMSMGVPTIGTDAGGVRELIEDSVNAYLTPPQAPSQLARTIRTLASDPAALTRLSKAGRAHIVEHFRSSLGAETLVEEIEILKGTQVADD